MESSAGSRYAYIDARHVLGHEKNHRIDLTRSPGNPTRKREIW